MAGERTVSARQTNEIELVFTYGSEKKNWIAEMTDLFNKKGFKVQGRTVRVVHEPNGSGIMMDSLKGLDQLKDDDPDEFKKAKKPHLISPASRAFIIIGNAEAREKGRPDLVKLDETQNLVSSPVVVAIWRDIAESLGWPDQPIRWDDVLRCASDSNHWKSIAKPAWGSFKFGHTHPDFSNSGLHTLFIEAYAAVDKFDGVSRADVANNPKLDAYLKKVEGSVVHYGESTGFLGEKMFQQGRGYLTAAILYENLVIDANKKAKAQGGPAVVAIYPEEGTFPTEHPVGIVQRDWVTPAHRQAAALYIDFLRQPAQQRAAKTHGFRPYDAKALGIPLNDLLRPEYGVDPAQPKRILQPPPDSVIRMLQSAWRKNKRGADIVLAIDVSGSMEQDKKIEAAEEGAKEFIRKLSDGDGLSIILFSSNVEFAFGDLANPFIPMNQAGKQKAIDSITGLVPGGDTALHSAVQTAHASLNKRDASRNRAIVVLSDGKDTENKVTLDRLLGVVRNDGERNTIYVFTIGYGKDKTLDPVALKRISDQSKAKYYPGSPETIRKVLYEIASFF